MATVDGIAITTEVLGQLERYYAPASEQKCVVCGAPLQFSATSEHGSGSRYNCSSADASSIRSTKPLRERLNHYAASAWIDRGQADMAVVALVRTYRAIFDGLSAELEEKIPDRSVRDQFLVILDGRAGRGAE